MFTKKIWASLVLSAGLALGAAGCATSSGVPSTSQEASRFEVNDEGVFFAGTSLAVGPAEMAALDASGNVVDVVEGNVTIRANGSLFALPSAQSWFESLVKQNGFPELRVYPGGMVEGSDDGIGIKKEAVGWGYNFCHCGNCWGNYCGACGGCGQCCPPIYK